MTRHRLRLFLGEAFGGSSALVDIVVARPSNDQAVNPHMDQPMPRVDTGLAPDWATILSDDTKGDPVTQVNSVLQLERQIFKRAEIVLQERADPATPSKTPNPLIERSITASEA
jgi:hypothetical protein